MDNFNRFINKGEIRRRADNLLGLLSAACLLNISDDNRDEINKRLKDIEESDIDWEKDVVKSVRERYKILTSQDIIDKNMNRWQDENV